MDNSVNLEPVGYLRSCFDEKFGAPRQSGLVPSARGQLELIPPYNETDAVSGLERVTHLWLVFLFHQTQSQGWKPKVKPPRLGGNKKLGVFATRSPFRPNPIGLSVVKLERVEVAGDEVILHISGVDLIDGTPVLDIKPYVPYVDAVPEAMNDIAGSAPTDVPVRFSQKAEHACLSLSDSLHQLIVEVLQQNPIPAYHKADGERLYKMSLALHTVAWRVLEEGVVVESITPLA